MKFGHDIKNLWLLDDNVTYLNHGSYGATPIKVIEASEKIQRELEREPVSYFADGFFTQIRNTAVKLASFVGADSDNLVLLDNATSAINTVLRSIMPDLNKDDEILINNHTYPAVKMACKYISDMTGCHIREIQLPYPLTSPEMLIDAYTDAVNDKTVLLILDHIFYTTGIINPIKEIVAKVKLHNDNVPVLVDGAHVPGMIHPDIESLGVDWYTGNCHKWLFAPKGVAFLWTAPEQQQRTKPLSISYYYNQSYTKEFDWTGTKNPAPLLALNSAIDFHNNLGKQNIFNYIHNLAIEARRLIADKLYLDTSIPDDMFGAMVSFELHGLKQDSSDFVNDLRKRFFGKYKIEVPFTEFDGRYFIRYSAQVYNDIRDYEKLIAAMKEFFNL